MSNPPPGWNYGSLAERILARLPPQIGPRPRRLPKPGLLCSTAHLPANIACQLFVE